MNNNDYNQYSTFIRNIYSVGFSCILVSYYKFSLSLLFQPFEGTDPKTGRSTYGRRGIMTTVTYEGAYGIWKSCYNILHGSVEASCLVIPCAGGATLTLEKKAPGEVFLTINKNNQSISFKFASSTATVKENGLEVVKVVETGLGAFMKMVDGYLTGTNSSGHLNKLGDDIEKIQEVDQQEKEQQAYSNQSWC